jgi:hypothetical protein
LHKNGIIPNFATSLENPPFSDKNTKQKKQTSSGDFSDYKIRN